MRGEANRIKKYRSIPYTRLDYTTHTHTHTHTLTLNSHSLTLTLEASVQAFRLGHGKWKLGINAYYITGNRIGGQ